MHAIHTLHKCKLIKDGLSEVCMYSHMQILVHDTRISITKSNIRSFYAIVREEGVHISHLLHSKQ